MPRSGRWRLIAPRTLSLLPSMLILGTGNVRMAPPNVCVLRCVALAFTARNVRNCLIACRKLLSSRRRNFVSMLGPTFGYLL